MPLSVLAHCRILLCLPACLPACTDTPARRLLIYELRAQDASAGKLLAPAELWYVTESAAQTLRAPGPRGNASLGAPVADPRVAELTGVLQDYMQRHRDPIDVHTGIFAPHIVVIPEVRQLPARINESLFCTRGKNARYAVAFLYSIHTRAAQHPLY